MEVLNNRRLIEASPGRRDMDSLAASNEAITQAGPARWFRRHARAGCAGIDIGADRVRLAMLRRRRGKLCVERLAEQPLGADACGGDGQLGDIGLAAQACRGLLRKHAPEAGAIVVAIPAAAAISTRLILPASSSPPQRLAQVRAELAAHGLPLDSLALDYRVLGPAPASPSDVLVLALCAPSLMAEDRLALAGSLELPLRAMPVDGWCVAAFLRTHETDAVLHLGAACWLSRRPHECLPLRWRAAIPAAIPGLLHELAPLLHPAPRRLLLTGPHPGLGNIAAALEKYAGLAAAVAAPRIDAAFAATLPAPALAPFHCALALAAEGLA
jgi:hypothetical protein